MGKQYRVTAPCLVHVPVMTATGPALGTVYAGDVLPGGVPEEKIEFWLDGGMIEEIEPAAEPEPEPDGPEVAKSGSGEQQVKTPERVTPEPAVPPSSGAGATKAAWVDYAVASGMDRAEAEAKSRDDLIKALKPE